MVNKNEANETEEEEEGEEENNLGSESESQSNPGNESEAEKVLSIKGVVYNEMKGVMSDNSSIFGQQMQALLFPTTTYHHNSGGEPSEIPKLSYQELLDFHKTHYHPSNSFFFTYGDLPMRNHFKEINKNVLSKFEKLEKLETNVQDEKRYSSPQTHTIEGPLQTHLPAEKQSIASVSWLLSNVTEPFHNFCWSILSHLLTEEPNGEFFKSLLDSGFGQLFSPGSGFDNHTRESSFSIGVQGVSPQDAQKLESLVFETLNQVVKEGFPKERIDTVIHQLEISQKHVTTKFGLSIISNLVTPWIHGANPSSFLSFTENLERFKKELESGPFLQNLIQQFLLDNPHRLTLIMNPSANYYQLQSQNESSYLDSLRNDMTPSQLEQIENDANLLKERQNQSVDNSCLPTLMISVKKFLLYIYLIFIYSYFY